MIAACGCGSALWVVYQEPKRDGIENFFSCARCGMEFSIFDPYPDEGDVAGAGTGTGTVLDAIQDAIRRETMFSEEW